LPHPISAQTLVSVQERMVGTYSPFSCSIPSDVVAKIVENGASRSEYHNAVEAMVLGADGFEAMLPEPVAAFLCLSDIIIDSQLDRSVLSASIAAQYSVEFLAKRRIQNMVNLFKAVVQQSNEIAPKEGVVGSMLVPFSDDPAFAAMPGGPDLFRFLHRFHAVRQRDVRETSDANTNTDASQVVPLFISCREFASKGRLESMPIETVRAVTEPAYLNTHVSAGINTISSAAANIEKMATTLPAVSSFVLREASLELHTVGVVSRRAAEAAASAQALTSFLVGYHTASQTVTANAIMSAAAAVQNNRPSVSLPNSMTQEEGLNSDLVAAYLERRKQPFNAVEDTEWHDILDSLKRRNALYCTSIGRFWDHSIDVLPAPPSNDVVNDLADLMKQSTRTDAASFVATFVVPFCAGLNKLRPFTAPVPTSLLYDSIALDVDRLALALDCLDATPVIRVYSAIASIVDRSATTRDSEQSTTNPFAVEVSKSASGIMEASVILSSTVDYQYLLGQSMFPVVQQRKGIKPVSLGACEVMWNIERILQASLAILGMYDPASLDGRGADVHIDVVDSGRWVVSQEETERFQARIGTARDGLAHHARGLPTALDGVFTSLFDVVVNARLETQTPDTVRIIRRPGRIQTQGLATGAGAGDTTVARTESGDESGDAVDVRSPEGGDEAPGDDESASASRSGDDDVQVTPEGEDAPAGETNDPAYTVFARSLQTFRDAWQPSATSIRDGTIGLLRSLLEDDQRKDEILAAFIEEAVGVAQLEKDGMRWYPKTLFVTARVATYYASAGGREKLRKQLAETYDKSRAVLQTWVDGRKAHAADFLMQRYKYMTWVRKVVTQANDTNARSLARTAAAVVVVQTLLMGHFGTENCPKLHLKRYSENDGILSINTVDPKRVSAVAKTRLAKACANMKKDGFSWLSLGEFVHSFLSDDLYDSTTNPYGTGRGGGGGGGGLAASTAPPRQTPRIVTFAAPPDAPRPIRVRPISSLPTPAQAFGDALRSSPIQLFAFRRPEARLAAIGTGLTNALDQGTLDPLPRRSFTIQSLQSSTILPGLGVTDVQVLLALSARQYFGSPLFSTGSQNVGLGALRSAARDARRLQFTESASDAVQNVARTIRGLCSNYDSQPIKRQLCEHLDTLQPRAGRAEDDRSGTIIVDFDEEAFRDGQELVVDLRAVRHLAGSASGEADVSRYLNELFGIELDGNDWRFVENTAGTFEARLSAGVDQRPQRDEYRRALGWTLSSTIKMRLITGFSVTLLLSLFYYVYFGLSESSVSPPEEASPPSQNVTAVEILSHGNGLVLSRDALATRLAEDNEPVLPGVNASVAAVAALLSPPLAHVANLYENIFTNAAAVASNAPNTSGDIELYGAVAVAIPVPRGEDIIVLNGSLTLGADATGESRDSFLSREELAMRLEQDRISTMPSIVGIIESFSTAFAKWVVEKVGSNQTETP